MRGVDDPFPFLIMFCQNLLRMGQFLFDKWSKVIWAQFKQRSNANDNGMERGNKTVTENTSGDATWTQYISKRMNFEVKNKTNSESIINNILVPTIKNAKWHIVWMIIIIIIIVIIIITKHNALLKKLRISYTENELHDWFMNELTINGFWDKIRTQAGEFKKKKKP